jgi:hypothetical protein
MLVSNEDGATLERLVGLVERGELRPAVDRTFPLDQAPAAIDYLTSGRSRQGRAHDHLKGFVRTQKAIGPGREDREANRAEAAAVGPRAGLTSPDS